jgi:hypothetical protein
MSNVGPVSRDLKSTVITSLFYTNFKSPVGPIRHVNVKCISGSVCNTPGRYGHRPRFDSALLSITLLILSQKKIDVILGQKIGLEVKSRDFKASQNVYVLQHITSILADQH